MKRMLKVTGWTLAVSYVAVCVLGWLIRDALLFFPPPDNYREGGPVRMLETAAGGRLAVWVEQVPDADYTLLYSHGNGESLGEVKFVSEMFTDQGVSFVAYDYSGYGLSSGKATVANTYRDIERVYRYVTEELQVEPAKVLVMGNSIGSGPATWLAVTKPVGGLVLQSAFTSVYRVVTGNVPVFWGSPFPNLRRLRKLEVPLLVIHGVEDSVIPFAHGQTLHQKAAVPKVFFPMPDTDHNEVLLFADEDYWEAFEKFMQLVKP